MEHICSSILWCINAKVDEVYNYNDEDTKPQL